MANNLSYKQKLKLVGLGALVALFLCYRLSISRTIDEYHKYQQESALDLLSGGDASSVGAIQARADHVGELMSLYQLDTLRPEKNLLAAVSDYCKFNDLQLKEYKPFGFSRTDSISVLTRTVTVSGAFIPCLKFVNAMENLRRIGRVSATEFKTYKDPQDKKLKLDCTIYIQNIIDSNHEPR